MKGVTADYAKWQEYSNLILIINIVFWKEICNEIRVMLQSK
jgi:hypothetical protein